MRARLVRNVLSLCLALAVHPVVIAQSGNLYFAGSVPEDPYAFPKYSVAFLNGYPVPNATAQRWLAEGLENGEDEFLGRDPSGDPRPSSKRIEPPSPDDVPAGFVPKLTDDRRRPGLQVMRMGTKASYLCLLSPTPSAPKAPLPEEKAPVSRSPLASWELLQPLSDGCLYYTHGWFTYAYCHGKYVKQFRQAPHAHPHPPGGIVPQEDPAWESYYLGMAPSAETTDVSPENLVNANRLELARGAGQRYLVQRWDDGTVCDKTGKSRGTEVQFHCSMTTTDKILLIKETSTCQYVLVIHTPRLCGEPGFKSERNTQEESVTRCREIVDQALYDQQRKFVDDTLKQQAAAAAKANPLASVRAPLPPPYFEARHPTRFPTGQARPQAIPKAVEEKPAVQDGSDLFRKALKALIGGDSSGSSLLLKALSGAKTSESAEKAEQAGSATEAGGAKSASEKESPKEKVMTIDGGDGQKIVVMMDDLDGIVSALAEARAHGERAGVGTPIEIEVDDAEDIESITRALEEQLEGNLSRLDKIRKNLERSLGATGDSAALQKGTKSSSDDEDRENSGNDGARRTYDEL